MSWFTKNVIQAQLPNHCGPTSLSSCLSLLGIDASPTRLAREAGRPVAVFLEGLGEDEIDKAARAVGAATEILREPTKSQGPAFAARLRAELEQGRPLVLNVDDTVRVPQHRDHLDRGIVITWIGAS
jgi:hypothetical protein